MNFNKLSIIMPVYNEENFVGLILEKIKKLELDSNLDKELIIIDDYSSDNTKKNIQLFINNNPSILIKFIKKMSAPPL